MTTSKLRREAGWRRRRFRQGRREAQWSIGRQRGQCGIGGTEITELSFNFVVTLPANEGCEARPLDSIAGASGILDHPPEPCHRTRIRPTRWRAMTLERAASSPLPRRALARCGVRGERSSLSRSGVGVSPRSHITIERAESPPTPRPLPAIRLRQEASADGGRGEQRESRVLAAHASEVCQESRPKIKRGRRECRVPDAPIASHAK